MRILNHLHKAFRLLFTLILASGRVLAQGLDPATILNPPADSWPTYHGDYSGKRHSPLTQITPQNVSSLTLAWAFQTGQPATLKSSPLLVNGVLYFTVPDNVWAVDARSGHQLWHYTYPPNKGLHIGHRGVAMYKDWLYFITPDAHLICLDAKNGKVRWNIQIANVEKGYWSTMSPLVVRDHVMVGGRSRHVVGYMKDFLFAQEQRGTPLEALSGGERGRLMLARALAKPSNLLVLDEPTNDLDLETLEVLEEMLGEYEGTVMLISHDRDFLDRIVTSVIAPDGNGKWIEYAGGYSDMLAQRGTDLRRDAVAVPEAEEKKEAKAAPPPAPKRRLNFNEKHALETLPKTIARLQAEIAKQQRLLDDPDLYKRDRQTFNDASRAIARAQQELTSAEDRWLELEVLREEIEQA